MIERKKPKREKKKKRISQLGQIIQHFLATTKIELEIRNIAKILWLVCIECRIFYELDNWNNQNIFTRDKMCDFIAFKCSHSKWKKYENIEREKKNHTNSFSQKLKMCVCVCLNLGSFHFILCAVCYVVRFDLCCSSVLHWKQRQISTHGICK